MSTAALMSAVPIFDGSNYIQWGPLMKSFLQFNGFWQVVDGSFLKPSATTTAASGASADSGAASAVSAGDLAKALREWGKDDAAAQGAMALRIRADLHIHVKDSAKETWDELKNVYGVPSMALKFSWFSELVKFSIPGNDHPSKELARFEMLVNKLTKADLELPEEILAMFLIHAAPKKYDSVISLVSLGASRKGEDGSPVKITVQDVKGALTSEWERQSRPAKLAQRISAVKHKGPTPSFNQQKQQPPTSPQQRTPQVSQQPQQKKFKPRKGRGRGGKAHGGAHVAQIGGHIISDQTFAYPTIATGYAEPTGSQPSLPPIQFGTINIPRQEIPTINPRLQTTDPRPRPPQRTTASVMMIDGAGVNVRSVPESLPVNPLPSTPSVWPSVNKARMLAERLEVPKTIQIMKRLESIPMEIDSPSDHEDSVAPISPGTSTRKRSRSLSLERQTHNNGLPAVYSDDEYGYLFDDDAEGEDDPDCQDSGNQQVWNDGSYSMAPNDCSESTMGRYAI
ncbi:hypothetical protein D9611_001166 [Ephemerocybe angulata]|uniref:DUF4219 domain-containing protein n=1 Tax=Ephemerocybe angulata TaxID=980116 RepID=A0A8H5CIU8_9AGAR|nr:hypothetical protein D9611_001166 [Tulosesus angulatus]